jgi:hypothetical protein
MTRIAERENLRVGEFEKVEIIADPQAEPEKLGPGGDRVAVEKARLAEPLFAEIVDVGQPAMIRDAGRNASSGKADLTQFQAVGNNGSTVAEIHR